jgi:hypothetical protein
MGGLTSRLASGLTRGLTSSRPASTVRVPEHPDARFATGMAGVATVNATGLERHLRRHLAGEVRFDAGSLAMYANDASNFRQVPIGVAIPRTAHVRQHRGARGGHSARGSGSAWVRRTSSRRSSPPVGRKGEISAKLRDLRDRYAADIRAGNRRCSACPAGIGDNFHETVAREGSAGDKGGPGPPRIARRVRTPVRVTARRARRRSLTGAGVAPRR